jgi:hypothetical protein
VVVEKWWNGMAPEEDMKPASAPGFGMNSASAEEEAPAMAAMEDRTWQSPNILPLPSWTGREELKNEESLLLLLFFTFSSCRRSGDLASRTEAASGN